MKQATLHRILATIFFMIGCLGCLSCYAQVKDSSLNGIDLLTKIVVFIGTIGGFFLAYMQVRMANEVEKVKREFSNGMSQLKEGFTTAIFQIKSDMTETLHKEVAKMEDKFALFGKDMELKMATKDDLRNDKEMYAAKQDLIKMQLESLKNQLDLITKMFKEK
jgi:hypothetical protein